MEVKNFAPGTPNWVDLGSPDPDAAGEFYSAIFGWDIRSAGPDAGGYAMCFLRDQPVAGLGPQQQTGIPPYWTTYISVADAAETCDAVRGAGGMVFVEPMDVMNAGRMAVCADNAGAPFSIWEPKDHIGSTIVNEPGTLCWNELATRSTDDAKKFYGEVFGWTSNDGAMEKFIYTEWQLGGSPVGGMMPMGDMYPPEVPAHWMVYFAVEDADATASQVESLGGSIRVPPTDIPPGRFSVLSDPQGAMFSVLQLSEAMRNS